MLLSLRKNGQEGSRLLNLRRLRSSREHGFKHVTRSVLLALTEFRGENSVSSSQLIMREIEIEIER